MRKNILIAVLLFIITALVLNNVYGWFTPTESDRVSAEVLSPKHDTIRLSQYTRDSIFITKYKPNVGELPQNNITKNYYSYVNDTLAPALHIAQSQIAELQQIKAKLEGVIQAQNATIDKISKAKTVVYADKYFKAETITDTLGNSTLSYNYNAQIDVVTANKRRFLKNDLQEIYITSPDKNFKINGVEHFKKTVQVPPRRLGFGVQAGYYFIPKTSTFEPAVGLGVSYNLIKL